MAAARIVNPPPAPPRKAEVVERQRSGTMTVPTKSGDVEVRERSAEVEPRGEKSATVDDHAKGAVVAPPRRIKATVTKRWG